ncbi:MAG TPA: type III-B CRISPR module RAMP protein Cmr6 [Mesotoga infera]|nr:type III-B CRISPR module RAMP protein Cmr6 [Mesotoga infera]HRV02777.1 type III-B CRISPR module RAMP protein Cmr6 [Mesotoga sp.]
MIDPNRIANRANRNSSLNYDKLFPISKHSMPDTSLLPGCLPELMNRFAYHDRNAVNNLMERRDRIVRSFKTIFDQELQTKKYLMVGSGCPSIFDNGFTLMRNYGIPYIPASAFKGAFSHYVAQELEKDSLVKRNYRLLFGTGEKDDNIRGALIFLDALPRSYSLGIDIINNHFQPYYSDEKNEKAPNDYYDPVPVQYLVIDSGSVFRFTVLDSGEIEDSLGGEIERELMDFLGDFGLGAKTSYGYGLFKKIK